MKTTTVEERLTRIEREFDELKHEVLGLKPRAKSWRQTVGAIPDDELSRNAEKLAACRTFRFFATCLYAGFRGHHSTMGRGIEICALRKIKHLF
jgi:hypothetical protein